MAGVRVPTLDVAKIVSVFGGGPVECAAACQSVGFSIATTTIRKWLKRGRLPMDGWLMIAWTYELMNEYLDPLDLNSFMVTK